MRRGSTLLLALVVLFVLASIGLALYGQAESGHRQARRQLLYNRAYYLAESGLQEGLDRLWRGPMPAERELAIADLDPPHRVVVRWVRGASGALERLEATATVNELSVTLKARVHLEGLTLFTRGRP
jgi:Tfp pilus assembly protein PilX